VSAELSKINENIYINSKHVCNQYVYKGNVMSICIYIKMYIHVCVYAYISHNYGKRDQECANVLVFTSSSFVSTLFLF